jgi:hypothetical protein
MYLIKTNYREKSLQVCLIRYNQYIQRNTNLFNKKKELDAKDELESLQKNHYFGEGVEENEINEYEQRVLYLIEKIKNESYVKDKKFQSMINNNIKFF